MLPLRCGAQNYEWGKHAVSSEVAQLAKANGSPIDDAKPYAELWMGTHPNCPSLLAGHDQTLQQWIDVHPHSLGLLVQQRFGPALPFLFKVLSIHKALSIQSHPDKLLAQRLHDKSPELYPDSNHKPEMALALSEFEALCGFCPLGELQQALRQVPELEACVGGRQVAALLRAREPEVEALRLAFTSLLTCEQSTVKDAIEQLVQRLQQRQPTAEGPLSAKEALALRLHSQFPHDVGMLMCFFMNLLKLQPGEAIFIPANVPHAYLSGEIMECMAASDNVVRAGLTPKFKDTETLGSSLTYEQGPPEVYEGRQLEAGVRVYQPPCEEFEIHTIQCPPSTSQALPVSRGPRLLVIQQGEGSAQAAACITAPELLAESEVARGSIFFIPAGTALTVTSGPSAPLVMWAASVNSALLHLHSQEAQAPQEAAAQPPVPAGARADIEKDMHTTVHLSAASAPLRSEATEQHVLATA